MLLCARARETRTEMTHRGGLVVADTSVRTDRFVAAPPGHVFAFPVRPSPAFSSAPLATRYIHYNNNKSPSGCSSFLTVAIVRPIFPSTRNRPRSQHCATPPPPGARDESSACTWRAGVFNNIVHPQVSAVCYGRATDFYSNECNFMLFGKSTFPLVLAVKFPMNRRH